MAPPQLGLSYDGVFDFLDYCDNQMVKVFDVAQQSECLLTNFQWVGGRKTFYHLVTLEIEPLTVLTFVDTSVAIDAPCLDVMPWDLVELGACTGAMSVGPQFTGARPRASLDVNRLACDHLASNNHGCVHHADLLDTKATRDLHASVGSLPHVTLFGFPCQPYSTQGLQLHQADPRSLVFWAGLRAIFLMQARACILECVTGVASDPNVHAGLSSIASVCGWRIHEVVLKLEDQWPMHRSRWWCLLCPLDWPAVDLKSWPVSLEFSRILDVLPRWGVWPCHQEDELLLSCLEFQYYSDPKYGKDPRFLSSSGKAATVLHSYGNALGPCPCQCRGTRFTENSLLSKGLRGFFVNSERYNQPRYLHACELAVLLTLPLSMKFEVGQRASLCLLGLVAAPLQALWTWTHLLVMASKAGLLAWEESPLATIRRYQAELLRQIHACFPFAISDVPASISISVGDRPLYLLRAGSFTMSQLASAECMSMDWGETVHFRDSFGTRLRADFRFFPGLDDGLEVIVESKKQCADKPIGLLMIGLVHQGQYFVSWAPAGTFLFMFCLEHGLPTNLWFTDDSDTLFGPDTRVWKSHMYTTIERHIVLPMADSEMDSVGHVLVSRSARGPMKDDGFLGLDDFAIWTSLLTILNQLTHVDGPVPFLVHPLLCTRLLGGQVDDKAWSAMRALFESSTKEVIMIFQQNGHWATLTASFDGFGLAWTYLDGLQDSLHLVACDLAWCITRGLDVDFLDFQSASHIRQVDDHTCGTVALLHVCQFLGFSGTLAPSFVERLHREILIRNGKHSTFVGNGLGSDQVSPGFSAFGCTVDHRQGLTNHTMWQAMTSLVTPDDPSTPRVVLVPPFRMSDFFEQALPELVARIEAGFVDCTQPILMFVEHGGHWIFIAGLVNMSRRVIEWTCFDGLDLSFSLPRQKQLMDMVAAISASLAIPNCSLDFDRVISQQHPFVCGTVAILHLGWFLGHALSDDPAETFGLHVDLLRSQYSGDFTAYGPGDTDDSMTASLAALLTSKGVPTTNVANRVSAVTQKLGRGAISKALSSGNPWASLKALASKPGFNVQLVHRDELEEHINARARDKHGVSISVKKKEKAKPQKASPSWTLDPKLLELLPGHFKDSEGDQVDQIDISQVTADARGIAICTISEARPYLGQLDSISTDALALLTVEEIPPTERGKATVSCTRFPAVYVPTKDPLLIHGCLIQLGEGRINRHMPKDPTSSMEVSTTHVVKVQVFQDEVELEWSQFVDSPLRCLFRLVPLLRLCTSVTCDHKCGCFHASVEEPLDQVIHETWGRRFQSLDGKTFSPVDAVLFTAFLRVTSQVVGDLLSLTVPGVYFEPRCEATKQTDPGFSVIWIPGATREIALHKLKLLTHGLSLVRMKTRFGIRVKSAFEAAAHAELRPGMDFIKVAVKLIYRVHPLPHGLQRQQVIKLLKEWSWEAKPLQPARGTSEGGAWEVGSEKPPPCNVLPAFGKDVLITLSKDRSSPAEAPSVVGPKRVQKHLQSQASLSKTSPDPWTSASEDPWAKYQPPSAPTAQGAQKRLDSFAEKLKTDIVEQVSGQLSACQSSMVTSDVQPDPATLDRMSKLEVGMAELHSQGQQFRQWFDETGNRLATQDAQIAQIHGALQQQQHELAAVRTEVTSTNQNMASTIQAMQSQLTNEMSNQLESQMTRFEQLLTAKKARKESD